MVAAVSTTLNPKTTTQGGPPQNPTRPPLLPSDPDNAVSPHRRPKSRQVTSRYMSSSSSSTSTPSSTSNSRRCTSPLVSRTTTMTPMPSASSLAKRSQSVERRRTATPRPSSLDSSAGSGNGEVSAAQKLLFTSARSLSVSFQGESFSLQVSKAKPAPSPSPSVRKGTPERRKATTPARAVDKTENSRLVTDQQRWPARLRQANCMSRSLDCTDERKKVGGSGSVVRVLQNSMADVRVSSFDGRLGSESEKTVEPAVVGDSGIGSAEARWSDPAVASDTESVSSGSTSGAQDNGGGGGGQGPRGPRGIMVPARFLQDAHNRLRRQPEPCSPSAKNVGTKTMAPPKLIAPKKLSIDCPVLSPRGVVNNRGQLSPVRGAVRPASPSKLGTSATSSPLRGTSPYRMRNAMAGTPNSYLSNTPSILSFAADIRSGKIGDNRIVDAHLLRLLHNRFLQWRFVNARAGATLSVQRLNAERSLYNAWITTSKLRESVRAKRTELQLLKKNLKLTSILKGHMTYLEEWALMDWDYSSSLAGATEALKASTLRLPVVGGAKADVQNVKDAICSAVDVMQAMASSICLLLSKVGDVNSLVAELAKISVKERALLHQCNDLLSAIAAMQTRMAIPTAIMAAREVARPAVMVGRVIITKKQSGNRILISNPLTVTECSLRTHAVQLKRQPSNLTQ